jgi:hypothetical protein
MALHSMQCSRPILQVARVLMMLVVVLTIARIAFGVITGVEEVHVGVHRWASMAVALVSVAFLALTTSEILKDVTPKGHAARLLCTSEALAGQLYLTILVARLVALHIFTSTESRERD